MYKSPNTKGMRETPMIFGVRGKLMMPMITVIVADLLGFFIAMVLFFFKKEWKIGFILMFLMVVSIIAILLIFRFLSVQKEYKRIKKRPDLITNRDLKDFID